MTELTDEAVKALLDGVAQNQPRICIAWCGKAKDECACYKAGVAVGALNAAAPDLARALLDARAERAQALADAQAAVALVVERFRHDLQFMVDSIAEDKAYVADKYPALFATIQARRAEMGTLGGVQVFGEIARDLLVLADADGLAAVEALRKERDHWETVAIARDANRRKAEAERDQARADAQAAVALVVEQAADLHAKLWRETSGYKEAQIRALAPASGVAKLAELRAERDHWETLAIARDANRRKAEAEREARAQHDG